MRQWGNEVETASASISAGHDSVERNTVRESIDCVEPYFLNPASCFQGLEERLYVPSFCIPLEFLHRSAWLSTERLVISFQKMGQRASGGLISSAKMIWSCWCWYFLCFPIGGQTFIVAYQVDNLAYFTLP